MDGLSATHGDVEAILRRISEAATPEDAIASGLMFHGTCETYPLPPRGGGYDGIVWTADTPAVAQTYIPSAGGLTGISAPDPWTLDERVRPSPHSTWHAVVRQMGFEALDVETDAHGSIRSWRVPEDWPTHRQAAAYLQDLGYDMSPRAVAWLSTTREGGRERFMPASWRMPGRLLVTLADGLDLADVRRGDEGDLTAVEYHSLGLFRDARAAGRDGVVINDFCQTKGWGNVGHVSRGLFPEVAARLPWIEVPASHFEWGASLAVRATPEFTALHEALAPSPGFRT